MKKDLCPIGKVVKPHGVRGKVKIDYFGKDLYQFSIYRKIFIKDHFGKPTSYEVLDVTPQPPRLILQLEGIETFEATEPLVGKEIFVRKEDLPELEEGEYYWFEILGMAVETEKGRSIGTVKAILPTGANDVYIVQGKRKEIFLPATEGVIKSIDLPKGVVKVLRMEGLWEDEDEV